MGLSKLNWRLIGPVTIATTSSNDIISAIRTSIVTNSTYWQLIPALTASDVLLIKPISGASSNINVIICNNITGSSAYQSPDINTSAAARMSFGLTPDITENGSGTFETHQSDRPFGPNPRWSKYWNLSTVTTLSTSFILESEESIGFIFRNSDAQSTTSGGFIGSVIETLDSGSGENDRRLYGMITGGSTSWSTNMFLGETTFPGHTATAGNPHAGVFAVSASIGNNDFIAMRPMNIQTATDLGEFTTPESPGKQIFWPLQYTSTAAPNRYIGRVRGLHQTEYSPTSGHVYKYYSSGVVQMFGVTARQASSNLVVLGVGPASGSGIV